MTPSIVEDEVSGFKRFPRWRAGGKRLQVLKLPIVRGISPKALCMVL
jgi:hypothetical protein